MFSVKNLFSFFPPNLNNHYFLQRLFWAWKVITGNVLGFIVFYTLFILFVLFCLIVSLVYEATDVVCIFSSLCTISQKSAGHRFSALLILTFLILYVLEENSWFCELLLKAKKYFWLFPHIYCKWYKKNPKQISIFADKKMKIFVRLSSSTWFPEGKGKKKIFKIFCRIKSYLLFFNTQKLIASEDLWEHFCPATSLFLL